MLSIKYKYVFILFLIPGMFLSCKNEGGQRNQGPRALSVEGFIATTEPFSETIRSTGDIMPYEEVEVRTPIAGNVLSIAFEEGGYVREGSLLVEIDSRTWKAQKKGMEAQLNNARKDLERKKQLLSIEGATQEEIDQAETMVSQLEAQIEELAVRIDLATIKAPFSGRLGMRDFSPGAYLAQGELVTNLVQDQQLRINFTVPARYASLFSTNMEVDVITRSFPDTIRAKVYAVDPMIDQNTRTMQVRAMAENQNGSIIAGDFATVITQAQINNDAVLIPAESIIPELNAQIVYVVKNGKAAKLQIETGTRTADRVHVLSGLAKGDTIITTGLMEIREGRDIEVTATNREVNP